MGDRHEISQWLSKLQHNSSPALCGKASTEMPWQASKSFSGGSWKKVWWLPYPLCRLAAELRLPHLTRAHLSYAATTLQATVPSHVPHWPRPRVTSQPDTGTASPLGSHRVTSALWADPVTTSGPALSRSHWLVFWASPQPCLSRNLSDLFTEPELHSSLNLVSCLQTHPARTLRAGALAGEPPMLPGLLACSALTPQHWQPAIPCWGWRSCWNWEYRPDTHKIKVWHCVRALLSCKKESKSILLSGKKYYFVLEHCSLCEGCWHSSKVKPLEQSFQKQNLYSFSPTLVKREPQLPATVCGVGWSHTTGTDCQCAD